MRFCASSTRNCSNKELAMPAIRLNAEWSRLMDSYAADHQNPINQTCHSIGIPLIAGSIPVAMSIVGIPLAAAMFTVGWGFQFVGHAFEGKKPSFVSDKRQLVVGLLWWTKKMKLPLVETTPDVRLVDD
jgi:uncharacterized membrane protein YGL010W